MFSYCIIVVYYYVCKRNKQYKHYILEIEYSPVYMLLLCCFKASVCN